MAQRSETFFYFSGMGIQFEISLEIKSKYVPGSNAFDPKEKFEGKVSSDAPKKLVQK